MKTIKCVEFVGRNDPDSAGLFVVYFTDGTRRLLRGWDELDVYKRALASEKERAREGGLSDGWCD
jgi:hypothetical protein